MTSKDNIKIQATNLTNFRKAIFYNAKRLVLEGEYLFKNNLFPMSAFLSITSVEEMGKFYLSRVYRIKNDQNKLTQKDWKALTNHLPKQLNSFLPPMTFKKDYKISPNISKLWELVADKQLMPTRNNCLYVGFDQDRNNILTPQQSISRNDALYFLETAFEVILLQSESLLSSLDCSRDFLFLQGELAIFKKKLQRLREQKTT